MNPETYVMKKRLLQPKVTRKITKDKSFKIIIPLDWAEYFSLEKGQEVDIELTDDGFSVKVNAKKLGMVA